MIRISTALLALSFALGGCARSSSSSSLGTPPNAPALEPTDVSQVQTFWMGHRPRCSFQRVRKVVAGSEAALRRAAFELRSNAVIEIRPLSTAPQRPVYEGTVVRLPPNCGLPG